MRYDNGVPSEISDLDENPASNRPFGTELAYGRGSTTDEHLRVLAAFIAQLHSRLSVVEMELKKLER